MNARRSEPTVAQWRRQVAVMAVLGALPLIVAASLMGLLGAYLLPAPSPVIAADPAGIVALRDGTIIEADQGTVRGDIAQWLNSNRPGKRLFEVGGDQFLGDSAVPTAESRGRLHGLALMLRAEQAVTARIVVHSPPGGDRRLAEQRARLIVRALAADGVGLERLGFELRESSDRRPLALLLERPARAGRER
jgi:hypothetical protein